MSCWFIKERKDVDEIVADRRKRGKKYERKDVDEIVADRRRERTGSEKRVLALRLGSACLLIDLYWIHSFLNFTSRGRQGLILNKE